MEGYKQIGLPLDAEAILLIEQDGPEEVVGSDMATVLTICEQYGAREISKAKNEQEAEDLRRARKDALSCLAQLTPTTMLEDATVPRSEIAPMVREIIRIAKNMTFGSIHSVHAGDGNLHQLP